jgi:chaperonin GroEL
VRSG